jgi:hypothetical protein
MRMQRDFGGGKLHRVSATLSVYANIRVRTNIRVTRQATVTWHTDRRDVSWGKFPINW